MSRSALVLCLLVAACSAAPPSRLRGIRPVLDGHIVGGEPVDISQVPWQVSLEKRGRHDCGGSIIGSIWVLTAAHCLNNVKPEVRAGTSTRGSGGSVFGVATIIKHENFDWFSADYDIGLLEISIPFSFGVDVQVVNIGTSEIASGTRVNVTGWGETEEGTPSKQLQLITTSIIDRDTCKEAYTFLNIVTDRMICAGEEEGGKDSCSGDSGGPLVVGNTQYGIVSWGFGCGSPRWPGVYTNVPVLRSWITEKAV